MKFRKYCALRRVLYLFWLKDFFVDIYAKLIYQPRVKKLQTTPFPKLLFFNSGHLGDALIMSYCLPIIKKKYPNIIIDVVCGEWCKFVFDKNPLIRNVIIQNHFMTNRSPINGLKKLFNHFKTARLAIQILKSEVYNFSIDVRHSGAVSHWILPFIHVRKSYGFGTRGYGGLLEKEFFLPDIPFHSYDMIELLLEEIEVETNTETVKTYLPFHSENKEKTEKKWVNLPNSLLLFPESGGEIKMFNYDFWLKFCNEILENKLCYLLLCGENEFTKHLFHKLQEQLPKYKEKIYFTGKIHLSTVAALPQSAIAAITLDSFPAHLSSIFCKTLVLSKNAAGYQYFPLNNSPTHIIHNHFYSKDIRLNRKDFSSSYFENLDTIFLNKEKMKEIITFLNLN